MDALGVIEMEKRRNKKIGSYRYNWGEKLQPLV